MACCQHDYRVRFVTAAELVTLLVEAQQQGRLARKLAQLARFDVVIIDELGYVPLDKAGADLLFGFISQRYERRSLVVTTNLPFARWSEVFLDPTAAAAVIDRIVHHATVLQTSEPLAKLRACGLARSRTLLVNTPLGPDRRLGRTGGTRRGGSRVSRRVLDRALGHRWVTDARRAPRGIAGGTGYVTRRTSWSAVSASTPNMQWHITFAAPRTRTWRPPNSSLRRPLTRSPAVRS